MVTETTELPKLKCLRCGHEWVRRIPGRPEQCPKCKSPYWDKVREAEEK